MYGHGGGGYGRGRSKNHYKQWKAPLLHDNKLSNIPTWEKKFCTDAFKINWEVFMNKKSWAQYDVKIPEWDDSAGEEAYWNARERYWAKYNRAPCNIPLPDPNMYINKVDHDCHLDPEIIAMLEDNSLPVKREGQGPVVLGIESVCKDNQWLSGWGEMDPPPVPSGWLDEEARKPTGWGEFDDCPVQPTGWGDAEAQPTGWGNDQADGWGTALPSLQKEHYSSNHGYNNGWEDNQHNENNCRHGWNNGWEDNHQNKDSRIDGWRCPNSNKNCTDTWGNQQHNDGWKDNPGWGQLGGRDNYRSDARDWSHKRGSNNSHHFSRYKVSRYQEPNDEYRLKGNGWRNGGSRKRGGTFEKLEVVKQRPADSWQWNAVDCRNGNSNFDNKRTNAWRWEKPVL